MHRNGGGRGSSSGCPGATKEAPVPLVLRTGCSYVQPGQPLELPLLSRRSPPIKPLQRTPRPKKPSTLSPTIPKRSWQLITSIIQQSSHLVLDLCHDGYQG